MGNKTVREYVKTRDLTKTLIVVCNKKVLYDSKYHTLEQFMKYSEREIINVHIGPTRIGLNVKEEVSD